MHWFVEHAPQSGKCRLTKFRRLTGRDLKEGAKIILKLLILTRRPVLRKNQGGLSNREKLREWLIFDSGSTGWHGTP